MKVVTWVPYTQNEIYLALEARVLSDSIKSEIKRFKSNVRRCMLHGKKGLKSACTAQKMCTLHRNMSKYFERLEKIVG